MSYLMQISYPERLKQRATTTTVDNIKEQKSRELSKFQALGALFRSADWMVDGDFIDEIQTPWFFGADVDKLGFGYYAPVHLLSSPNWKIRMSTAWCLIGDAERNIARRLDYSVVHNFWPDTSFCEADWDEEVKRWVASLPSPLNVPVEFKIARSVGQPSRDALVFAE